jgi:hypothetical protein
MSHRLFKTGIRRILRVDMQPIVIARQLDEAFNILLRDLVFEFGGVANFDFVKPGIESLFQAFHRPGWISEHECKWRHIAENDATSRYDGTLADAHSSGDD